MNPTGMIRWDLVHEARNWYHRSGYRYVEAPWIVTQKAIKITLPPERHGYYLGHPEYSPGFLVGSAEQAFLQMMLDGKLDPGMYFAAGPCFRDEPKDDEFHSKCFFKVELIEIAGRGQKLNDDNVYRLLATCKRFFEDMSHQETKVVPTPAVEPGSYDIELNGVEIGSYGLRSYKDLRWVYGTGLALPRFNQAAERIEKIWDPW